MDLQIDFKSFMFHFNTPRLVYLIVIRTLRFTISCDVFLREATVSFHFLLCCRRCLHSYGCIVFTVASRQSISVVFFFYTALLGYILPAFLRRGNMGVALPCRTSSDERNILLNSFGLFIKDIVFLFSTFFTFYITSLFFVAFNASITGIIHSKKNNRYVDSVMLMQH